MKPQLRNIKQMKDERKIKHRVVRIQRVQNTGLKKGGVLMTLCFKNANQGSEAESESDLLPSRFSHTVEGICFGDLVHNMK